MKINIAILLSIMGIANAQTVDSAEEWRSRLNENTRQLAKAFESKDKAREDELYAERNKILIGLRDSKPKSKEPPKIDKGIVERKTKSEIEIRRSRKEGVSIEFGRIYRPKVQEQYDAIQVGDLVELHFTHEPSLYSENYIWELTKVVISSKPNK